MTTVFADINAGVMVCDSKCTGGGTWYPVTKVFRIGRELVGCAGDLKAVHQWLKWYQSGKRGVRPKTESFSALSLREDGLFEHCEDGLELLVERGFHGIGSGGAMAVAAFMAGADPKASVEIALQIDANSGGEIHTHTLKS